MRTPEEVQHEADIQKLAYEIGDHINRHSAPEYWGAVSPILRDKLQHLGELIEKSKLLY